MILVVQKIRKMSHYTVLTQECQTLILHAVYEKCTFLRHQAIRRAHTVSLLKFSFLFFSLEGKSFPEKFWHSKAANIKELRSLIQQFHFSNNKAKFFVTIDNFVWYGLFWRGSHSVFPLIIQPWCLQIQRWCQLKWLNMKFDFM